MPLWLGRKRKKTRRRQQNAKKRSRTGATASARPAQPTGGSQEWPNFYGKSGYEHLFADLEPISLPGRASYLPPLYRYNGIHPQRHLHAGVGSSYVYLLDGSVDGNELAYQLSLESEIPKGSSERMVSLGEINGAFPFTVKSDLSTRTPGLLELLPGDWIFCRRFTPADLQDKTYDPKRDVMQGFAASR